MSAWNEQTLRKAASWKAFKEGAALFDSGCVSEATATPAGWRGTVRAGKKPLRVSVSARSATDLEARCPCPENQATGALCSHAVATGLAVLRGLPDRVPETSETRPIATATPRDLVLGPRRQDALARGKLALSITPSTRTELHEADLRLHAQCPDVGATAQHLVLGDQQLADFLAAIAGHPGVTEQPGGSPVDIATGQRLPLAEVRREGGEVVLIADADAAPWHRIGDALVRAGDGFIHLMGDGGRVPESLRPVASALVSPNKTARLPLHDFLVDLPSWQDWLEFPDQGWLADLHFVPAKPRFRLSLDGSLRALRARLVVIYADCDPTPPVTGSIPSLPRMENDVCEVRDTEAEANACRVLQDAGFVAGNASDEWSLAGESAILSFFAKTMPGLRANWIIEESQAILHQRDRILVAFPKIEIVGSGDDWLDFRLHYETQDGRTLPDHEIRSLIRSGSRHRKLSGDRHLWVGDHSATVLESLIEDIDLQQQGGHFTAQKCAAEVIKNFQRNASNSLIENNEPRFLKFQKPTSLQAVLRHYQSQGCTWLADRIQRYGGALLADDMGLGKTIQTIALIEYIQQNIGPGTGPVLVIATTSLLGNWRAEFARFAPDRPVQIIHGGGRELARDSVGPGGVLITSYGTLARDLAWHLRQHYRLIVADEASLMRNPDTDHARAVAKLRSDYRIALTGTPVENGVRDLWSIFHFIQPGWLGDRAHFRERYEQPLAQADPPRNLMRVLQLKTSPFILRRTKQEVAPELPGKLEIDEFCDLSRDQSAVYRELLVEGRRQVESLTDKRLDGPARMRVLTTLLRLRQTCCDLALLENDRLNNLPISRRSAKIERLMELLEQARDGGHRVLVFSQFRKQLLEIEKFVKEADLRSLRLDGQTRNRQQLVDEFQKPGGPDLFLISLKAGGYGLNLTAADIVIHFDPWWNPAAEAQATDRAHRIGQTRPVTVYRLLTRGTVEEKVLRLQSRKRDIARLIDETGEGEAPVGLLEDPARLRALFES